MTAQKTLTRRQKLFVEEYLVDANATQAAIRSGYSAKTAYSLAQTVLRKPHVAAEIAAAQKRRSERTQITADKVLTEMARVGLSDIRHAFDEDGKVKPIDEWSNAFAAAVSYVEFSSADAGEIHKIRLWDKTSALDKIAKHLGMFARDNEQRNEGVTKLTDLLAAVAEDSGVKQLAKRG
ncbi:MAG: terminase small subunit [Salinisphaera sp.]|nr:terminase small subunit [Salinisphaera sp.]